MVQCAKPEKVGWRQMALKMMRWKASFLDLALKPHEVSAQLVEVGYPLEVPPVHLVVHLLHLGYPLPLGNGMVEALMETEVEADKMEARDWWVEA
jgi:hypothetical protein